MVQSKIFPLKSFYLCRTNNEIVQNSNRSQKNSHSCVPLIQHSSLQCFEKPKTPAFSLLCTSVPDPNPDPHVFGPPGSGSISQRYGSGSGYGSGSFSHQAKIIRKTLIPTICDFFWNFYLLKWCKCNSKSNKQKIFCSNLVFVGIVKVNDENRRIRIRIWIH
jgi:hypothetical protein